MPELSKHREFELFSSVLPIVIENFCKCLIIRHGCQFLVLPFDIVNHPSFSTGKGWIFPSSLLQLDKSLGKELRCEDNLTIKLKFIRLALQEDMINLIELITIQFGQIEVIGEPNIVGLNFSKLFRFGDSLYRLYLGDNDIIFLIYRRGGGLCFAVDIDHKFIVVGVKVIEDSFRID